MKRVTTFLASIMLIVIMLLPALRATLVKASPVNLITNPFVETANPANANAPLDWSSDSWGTNTTTFSYLKTGSAGDTNSVSLDTSAYTSGDSEWYFNPVNVTAGTQYNYSEYYEASAVNEIDVVYAMSGGTTEYQYLNTLPASSTWEHYSANFTVPSGALTATVFDIVYSAGSLTTDDFSLTPTSTPTVAVSAPTANATVSGSSVALSATATDASGIKNVQFQINGANVGSSLTASPYNYSWNSTTVANGTYQVTAVATNNDGQTSTSSSVAITVNNPVPAGTNLIPNPLLETANPTNSTLPLDWQSNNWGTNTTTFSYLKTGSTGDTSSVNVKTTAYTSGASEWLVNPVSVTAGTVYNFSDYYESNVATTVEVEFVSTGGTLTYLSLGNPAASTTWKQFTGSFTTPAGTASASVYQFLSGVGSLTTDDYSLAASTTPSVSVTAPAASTTTSTPYSGNLTLSATVNNDPTASSVQFEVDGVKVGSPDTTAPYSYTWNSTSVTNGTHAITAVVTNSGSTTTISSPAISVNIDNPVAAGSNLIPNPLMTTVDPSNANEPANWSVATWGTNTFTSSYLNTGSAGDSNSVEINMTAYTSGDAKWIFTPQTVTQDTQYQFSDWYKSSVQTQVDAVFTMSDGTTEYEIIGIPYAETNWTEFSSKFSVPLGAQTITIYHLIQSVGTLTIDNANLSSYKPVGFTRPIVTLTFDDGYQDTYTNGLPLLEADGFTSTQFIVTDEIGTTGFVTTAQVKDWYAAGDEIASHTVTHDDMTQETTAQIQSEMTQSQATLETDTGHAITDFAYPFGLYNAGVVSEAKNVYSAARGVESGLNSKDNYNAYDLKVEDIYNTTTTAQVADWVAQAQATNTWLIFVYHSVDANQASTFDGNEYNVTPTQLSAQLAAIKASGVTVETMAQALAEVTPQI